MLFRNRRLAFVIGGALLIAGGTFAVACGTDNGTTQTPTPPGRDSSTSGDETTEEIDGNTPVGDAAPDCDGVPKPRSGAGVFCFGGGEGGAPACDSITKHEICCSDGRLDDGGFAPSTCKAPGNATSGAGYKENTCAFVGDGGAEFHCTEAAHCPNAGEVCCATAGTGGTPRPGTNNDYPKECNAFFQSANAKFLGGTRCKATTCGAGELTLCASDADCKAGKCYSIKIANRLTGVCQVL